jgi:predicted amidohydrolase
MESERAITALPATMPAANNINCTYPPTSPSIQRLMSSARWPNVAQAVVFLSSFLLLVPTDSLLLSPMSSGENMRSSVTRIAISQLRSTSNKANSLIDVAKCAGWAKQSGSVMLFLPECLGFMGDNATHTLEQADAEISLDNKDIDQNPFHKLLSDAIISPDANSKIEGNQNTTSIVQALQFIARESNLWISGGGVHTRVPTSKSPSDQKIYNTHVIIDNNGLLKAYYHKIHLFDVSIPGKVNLQESKTTEPGTKLVLCDSPIGKLGLSICYDMRFSEMYVDLVNEGAQVLLAPSAFTVPTGKAHWHALLRGELWGLRSSCNTCCYYFLNCISSFPTARAIESQCYMIAAAQVGKHNEKRQSYGHSLVYDPWGELLADAGGFDGVGMTGIQATSSDDSPVVTPSIVTCEIDLNKIASVRESMPMQQHRANSKYSLT